MDHLIAHLCTTQTQFKIMIYSPTQNYTFETPSGETAVLLEFDVVGRDEVDSVARIPVLVAHERRGTVLMGRLK